MKRTRLLAIAMIGGAASLMMSAAPGWAQARPAEPAATVRSVSAIAPMAPQTRNIQRLHGLRPPHLPRRSDPIPAVLRNIRPYDIVCDDGANIESAANGEYVAAEVGYSGNDYAMLQTVPPPYGQDEQFDICDDYDLGVYYIVSDANGLIVSSELGYTGNDYAMLRARASTVGGWESFSLECTSDGYLTMLAYANSSYVSAELGYSGNQYGMLRARSSSVGPWEEFNTVNSHLSC